VIGQDIRRNLRLGINSLRAHKLRAALTALGIVFGVASVICMLAIGEGLSFEAREQIRRLGSDNIILRSVKPPARMEATSSQTYCLEYGLTYADMEHIRTTIPHIELIVQNREMRRDIWRVGMRVDGCVVGTVPWYPEITNSRLLAGRFLSSSDMRDCANVCVLSDRIVEKLGGFSNPIGDFVKIGGYGGGEYYQVIGILESGGGRTTSENDKDSGIQNEIYVPLTAARSRFGEILVQVASGTRAFEKVELHRAIVKVDSSENVITIAGAVEAVLKKRHDKQDYEMIVPLQLLQEKERTKRLYNIVLGLMAAISLLVGGIGIMNIMLANISERTPEIGIRRAVGAKKRDIVAQFLTETVLLSGLGGVIGVLLGFGLRYLIGFAAGMTLIITPWSVALAFGISAMVGFGFGFYPAVRAANLDPIQALRHE
jgi:putative ABC transport system permease protein